MDVLQLWRERLVAWSDGEEGNATGDLQVAADSTGTDSVRRPLVYSVTRSEMLKSC
jgi:hypothetical protein